MKTTLIILSLLFLLSCKTVCFVDESGKEYVRIEELGLSAKDQIKLNWLANKDTDYCFWSNRYQEYYFDKNYDYSKILNHELDSTVNRYPVFRMAVSGN